jgi:signal transduction histidine kinase/DNA-binding response OmpR family regulator
VQPYSAMAPFADGLLVGGWGGLELLAPNGSERIGIDNYATVLQVIASRVHAGRVYKLVSGRVEQFQRNAASEWIGQKLTESTIYVSQMLEDSNGDLWLTTRDFAIYRLGAPGEGAGHLLPVRLQNANGEGLGRPAVLTSSGEAVFVAVGAEVFTVNTETTTLRKLASLPVGRVVRFVADRTGRNLRIAFSRDVPGGAQDYGIGSVELDEHGAFRRWTEHRANVLEAIGTPTSLYLDEFAGGEVLWVGGTRGLAQLRVAELPAWTPPREPRLISFSTLSQGTPLGESRSLTFRILTDEIWRRQQLWFQHRFEGEGAQWSTPTQNNIIHYGNVGAGTYTLAVRVVDAAGNAGEVARTVMKIERPWWLSPPAIFAYAIMLGIAAWLLVRGRDAIARRRTAELERIVQERTAELHRANSAKDEFLASMSHEIRNPLNGVVAIAGAIDEERLEPHLRERFRALRQCADHLASLLDDLLEFSKLQSGPVKFQEETFDVRELAQSLVGMTSAESAAAGMVLQVAVAPAVPRWVRSDLHKIRQVLLNFLTNAFRYATPGRVLLTVWAKPLRPGTVEVIFAVSDDGPGISAEEQQSIFKRFSRGAAARSRSVPGSGIGLPVCRTIAEQMGARIWLESKLGAGSTFYFAVPLEEALPPEPTRDVKFTGTRALLVDDESYNLVALKALLEPLGIVAIGASCGAEALERARSGEPFDLVFLDFELPDIKGPDLARQLRETPAVGQKARIIAATAYASPAHQAACHEAGMNAVLVKPLTTAKILGALALALETAHPADNASSSQPAVDPLELLRLLASQKQTSLAAEWADFQADFRQELSQVHAAVEVRDHVGAQAVLHKLRGRIAFIRADSLRGILESIEACVAKADWAAAQHHLKRFGQEADALFTTLAPAAQLPSADATAAR